jgi:Xaa-Pro aminopeptidase
MMVEGENLLKDEDAKKKTGFTDIYPVTYLDEFIARRARSFGLTFHLRLSPRDSVDNARWETLIFVGRKNRIHYNDQISLDNYRIKKLKERYPVMAFDDITPYIDEMRVIKSAEEREILRRNGKISAEGVKQAILATRPGIFEYQIEAAAIHVILKNGAKGAAYPPIVGSGPNSCIWHYDKNARKVEDGDLVLMDFGADLDYLCMDITRTWPVSGKFMPEQREFYEIVLAVQKACIEAYRPGVTSADVQKHVAEVMKEKGLDPRGLRGGIGHYVGMCVHDVGPRGPLREGMVFAIEPALYYPEKGFGIRIEDTVLITKDGCEVLTKDVPKEVEEIEKLMSAKR